MRMAAALVLILYLLLQPSAAALHAQNAVPSAVVPPVIEDENNIEPHGYRSGRGGFRPPVGGYPGRINPGYGKDRRPGANDPVNRTPAAPGRYGGFFGGLFAGTFLASLLNPFGFGNAGFSLIGLLFWAVILYFAFRLLRRVFGGGDHR